MLLTDKLLLYRNLENGNILYDMAGIINDIENGKYEKDELAKQLFICVNEIISLSVSHGYEGNLWHTYLTYLLANN